MLLEEQRHIHEELERLEDACAELLQEDQPHVRPLPVPVAIVVLTLF